MKKKGFKLCTIFVITMMMLSILPLTATFAASDNTLDRTQQVAVGHEFTIDDATILRITERNFYEFNGDEAFRLVLENAEWNITDVEAYKAYVNNLNTCAIVTDIAIIENTNTMSVTFAAWTCQ